MANGIENVQAYTQVYQQPQSEAPTRVSPPETNLPQETGGVSGVSPQVPENERLVDTYG